MLSLVSAFGNFIFRLLRHQGSSPYLQSQALWFCLFCLNDSRPMALVSLLHQELISLIGILPFSSHLQRAGSSDSSAKLATVLHASEPLSHHGFMCSILVRLCLEVLTPTLTFFSLDSHFHLCTGGCQLLK